MPEESEKSIKQTTDELLEKSRQMKLRAKETLVRLDELRAQAEALKKDQHAVDPSKNEDPA